MIGRTLAHYEVVEKLGEGGMGVVYKARDTHLDRFVAVKLLPADKVADPERKRRFALEAKAASALNHPNIVTIHDISEADGVSFIVMEYVSGRTLAESIPRRGLPLTETLKHAIPIADALSAAHAAGIVHRDFKPGNVMIDAEGRVKVVDFGLAKLVEDAVPSEDEATLEAGDRPRTAEGILVGTVGYMSPEQAEGKRLDARSDIFSFGAVLYEMVTGRRAFQGDSQASTLAAVLRSEPPAASELVENLPEEAQRVISRCLRKDPSRRFQHIADVKVALQELKEESDSGRLLSQAPPRSRRGPSLTVLAAGTAAAIAVGAGAWLLRPRVEPPPPPLVATPLTSDPGSESGGSFSPDGTQLAFFADLAQPGNQDIYVKLIGGGPPLRLTTNPLPDVAPAWSPSGTSIAFLRGTSLGSGRWKVMLTPALGGTESSLGEVQPTLPPWRGSREIALAWLDDQHLIAADSPTPGEAAALVVLSVATGEKRPLTRPTSEEADIQPAVSPDGRHVAFARLSYLGTAGLNVLDLSAGGAPSGEPRRLDLPQACAVTPAWTADGRELVYRGAGPYLDDPRLWRTVVGGQGTARPLGVGENGQGPALSRRKNRLVYTAAIPPDGDIWRVELTGREPRPAPVRFISSTREDNLPQYSPDGKRIAFSSRRLGPSEVWVSDSDGTNVKQLTSLGTLAGAPRWSPDGRRVAFDGKRGSQQSDVFVIDADGGVPRQITEDPAEDRVPCFSADGGSISFASNRSGRSEIWRMPSAGGAATQLTRNGGDYPVESPDGTRIYYQRATGAAAPELWSVPAGGGQESLVVRGFTSFDYAAMKDGIFFIARDEGSNILRFLDFASGRVETRANLGSDGFASVGMSLSPDRRYLLFTVFAPAGGADLMMVENFQ